MLSWFVSFQIMCILHMYAKPKVTISLKNTTSTAVSSRTEGQDGWKSLHKLAAAL